jgi:hypothetical protein
LFCESIFPFDGCECFAIFNLLVSFETRIDRADVCDFPEMLARGTSAKMAPIVLPCVDPVCYPQIPVGVSWVFGLTETDA